MHINKKYINSISKFYNIPLDFKVFQNPGGYLYAVFEIVRFKYIQNIPTISYIHPVRHGRFLVNTPFHPCIHLNLVYNNLS